MSIDPKRFAERENRVLTMIHELREQVACLDMIGKFLAMEMVRSQPNPHAYVDRIAPVIMGIGDHLAEVSTPATQKFLEAFVSALESAAGPRKSS